VQHNKHLLLTLITLFGGITPLQPASAANEQQRLQQLRSNISELRQDIGSDKQQQTRLQKELKRLEKQVADANHRLRDTEEQLARQRQAQQQLQAESNALNQKLERQKQLLSQQLRASYTPSEQQTLKLLLNQTSPAEAGRILTYYGYFSRAQLHTIEATRSSIDKLQETDKKLQQGRDKLEALKHQQQQEQDELAEHKAEHKTLLGKLNNRIQGNERSLATMLADEQALTKLLRELEAKQAKAAKEAKGKNVPDSGKLKGKLQWPTKGKIEHSFGDSRNQGRMTWQGVMISGEEGQEIRAISSGKVVFADWMRGYGLLLIIDHGNNLMSLYGHNQSLYKKTGDNVGDNEAVAALGSSDNGNEAALYFELRHKGKPVDPEKWLR
jgi:septal ring factor EnvC (AmiA/AmiB activator)